MVLRIIFFLSFFSIARGDVGFDYQYLHTDTSQSIHILKVDPAYFEISLARALDHGIGRETTLSLCTRHQAMAAINGGFFQMSGLLDGRPVGILKIGNQWFSLPNKPRGAIGWSKDGTSVLIDRLIATAFLQLGNEKIAFDGLNRKREKGEVLLFTPSFHNTTLTPPNGDEFIFSKNRLQETRRKKGSSFIPVDGWVVSASLEQALTLDINDEASYTIEIQPQNALTTFQSEDWLQMDYIVGGVPVLIHEGKMIKDVTCENAQPSFFEQRHPRTAIGLQEDGTWIFVVVDGRQPGVSEGMTIKELAQFMFEQGCFQALNLDGGGSSTMVIEGKVLNCPTGSEVDVINDKQRKISDAILIHRRQI